MRKGRAPAHLQACLLLQLYNLDRHGYELLQGLHNFISDAHAYDPSVIYRFMRGMEQDGLVVSYEGDVSLGPKRRMYRLTPAGKQQLNTWIETLKRSRDEIDHLLSFYEQEVCF
jgi:DNA-binding PadR family transcriptional regulator